MTKTQSDQMSNAEMQRQAQKIAQQAAKLANQAGPITMKAALAARQGTGAAMVWATPHANRIRSAMAQGATKGSASMQETIGPWMSEMLLASARKLEPPQPEPEKSRRWPLILAAMAMLAAIGTAAAAFQMQRAQQASLSPESPTGGDDPSITVLNPSAETDYAMSEAEVDGTSQS